MTGGTGLAEPYRGRTVLLASDRQLPAVQTLLQLDGIAGRLLLCPPDLDPAHLPAVMADAAVDAVISDGTGPAAALRPDAAWNGVDAGADRSVATEWVLFTSGTTGRPKLVRHTLASLAGPLTDGPTASATAVWSTFYDVRRYGGLQILLRALLGGGSLVLSQAGEAPGAFLDRAGEGGVTHMLGTPSHWRRALMTPAAGSIAPHYVRLSGEVADQGILDQLAAAYPAAALTHAFASTEAGVGFEVKDGLAGFPPSVLDGAGADIRVVDGTLRIRSGRTASGYLGGRALADADGFVDTGDLVERRGSRLYFVGRREGVINVGGQKVYPEEVEAVINDHPQVQMSRVRGRPSPITGAIVVADVVMRHGELAGISAAVLDACRVALPAYKVPAMLYQVPAIGIAASGKLVRAGA